MGLLDLFSSSVSDKEGSASIGSKGFSGKKGDTSFSIGGKGGGESPEGFERDVDINENLSSVTERVTELLNEFGESRDEVTNEITTALTKFQEDVISKFEKIEDISKQQTKLLEALNKDISDNRSAISDLKSQISSLKSEVAAQAGTAALVLDTFSKLGTGAAKIGGTAFDLFGKVPGLIRDF